MSGVVTIGETMALLGAPNVGPLQHEHSLDLSHGGAESNVAVALARLGTEVTWIGKVGADPLGELIVRELRAEGVRVEAVRDSEAPTSLMIKEHRTGSGTQVYYYRRGNAGGRLRSDEIDLALVRGATLLHVTGISPALSETMRQTIFDAVTAASEAGVPISMDLNYRSKLWTREEAAAEYARLLPHIDIVFAGDDEAAIVVGEADDPLELAHRLIAAGAKHAVIKLGEHGAVAVIDGAEHRRDAVPVNPVDTVGAGDAFVGAFLAERLNGEDVATCLTTAVTAGALACLVRGDWQGSPRRSELGLLGGGDPVSR
ncbi:2-dehydro-3-deoxygluconokinase [Homoserinimonas aerilata]|uniref:2-dehydro-3-deoxygluconokinase n=1 Tax=Homoserinimonas aerilata TaxID=1162970 RepID=A0A542YGM0_9MICO|nr:sugar kinase [Homoserinimonas aerilata]TQL47242.1 2-dehydro-3-deoxygluconokinase [Homoserinimonas aerilata]